MTIFNTLCSNGKYPVMRFCKTLNNGESYKVLAEIKNVQFYNVNGKTVEVWTYPKNKDNQRYIKGVDFINSFTDYE